MEEINGVENDASNPKMPCVESVEHFYYGKKKLAGNSIVVSCLYHIFMQMFITPRVHKPVAVQLSLF